MKESIQQAKSLAQENIQEGKDGFCSQVLPLAGTHNFMRIYHEKLAESTAYNLGMFYRLKDGVDIERLKSCITEVMRNHEAFRVKLVKTEGGAGQILVNGIKEPEIIETTEKELNTITDNLIQPYELYGQLLYKCIIIRTETGKYLFFEMHHIITDGTSMQIILKEIEDAYNGLQIQKDKYFTLMQERLSDRDTEQYRIDKEYYQVKTPSAERVNVPAFDFSGEGFLPGLKSCRLDLPEEAVEKLSGRYGLSPTKLFIMCYLITLSRLTGKTKVGTAYTVHGRFSKLSENVVGMLLYSYFVGLDIGSEDTIEDIAGKMKAEMDEVRRHNKFDCTSFMTETNIEEMACSNILYQGKLRDFHENVKDLVAEEIELPNPYYKASYFCEFEIVSCGDYMNLDLYYNASRYSKETAEKILCTYRDVCTAVFKPL